MTVRDLRNHGGAVLDDVARGSAVVVTRDGAPVAELRPLAKKGLSAAELVARRRNLPAIDPDVLRADVEAAVDTSL
ncbi:hypothetical protein GCM10017607_03910 [Microbacterium thalassium]|nr:hypothetical protein GCM10017607_03910 [Microbacterium thalassium]